MSPADIVLVGKVAIPKETPTGSNRSQPILTDLIENSLSTIIVSLLRQMCGSLTRILDNGESEVYETKLAVHLPSSNEEEVTIFVVSVANIGIHRGLFRAQQYQATYPGIHA